MDSPLSAGVFAGSMTTRMDSNTSAVSADPRASAPTDAASPCPSSSASSSSSNPPPPLASALAGAINTTMEVDAQILEALRSKDRIYVLKLGEQFEGLIKERRTRVEVSPATSYQRLLVHRCSAYYKLQPESDPVTKALYVLPTPESKIPERRICELIPAESTSQPAFKIMKRAPDRRKPHSHAGSIAGEDADLSDVEPSEAGSLGGQSNITNGSNKKRMTIEEREAAYNEARSRIFMGFEEKEKSKDKDMSASSSSLSVSGSTSTSGGGRSSAGDTDDLVSSPATESEWSTPSGAFGRDKRRGGGAGGPPSSRSLRSGGSFHGTGSGGSSRNSRAASPSSFSYATLYEPPPTGHAYDGSHQPGPNMGYQHPQHYSYAYPPPNSGPSPPFMPSYPYYSNPSLPYPSPPPMQPHNPSDPSSPPGSDQYPSHHPINYGQPYGWPPLQSPHSMQMSMPPPPQQQQQQQLHQLPQQNGPPHMGPMSPPSHLPSPGQPPHTPPYPPYGVSPQHAYNYPMNQYYPSHPALSPPGQPGHHPMAPQVMPPPPQHGHQAMGMHPQQQQQQVHPGFDMSRNMNSNPLMHLPHSDYTNAQANQFGHNPMSPPGPRNGLGNGVLPMSNNTAGRPISNGSNRRGMQQIPPPANTRSAWSYGPGVSLGGFPTGVAGVGQSGAGGAVGGNDSVGPRFNSSNNPNRRTSGHTNSGGNSRASSNCDDVSSIASSSTSSSSRRTYTSTTSSQQQHPLPPRPDWAVGIKAQPTLASRHHDQHSLNNSRTMSPISPTRSLDPNSSAHNSGRSSISNTNSNNSPRQPTPGGLSSPSDFPPLISGGPSQEKRGPMPTGAWGSTRPVLSPTLNGSSVSPAMTAVTPQSPKSGAIEDGKVPEIYTPKLVRRTPLNAVNLQAATLAGQVASMSLVDDTGEDMTLSTQSATHAAVPSTTLA